MDDIEDDSCSHYQINLQQFKQTIREKANLGFRSLGRATYISARRSIQFIDELPTSQEEGNQDYSRIFGPSVGSLSDTPPNTPSSSESTSSVTSQSPRAINDPQKNLTETIRKQAQKPSGGETETKESSAANKSIGTDNYWIGQKIAEKRLNSNTPMLRNYWEQNSEREKQEQLRQAQMQSKRRPFGFPKWRSNDAMSASLVASGKVASMIPKDSNIPEHRKQKLEETERKAEVEKQQLHQSVIPKRPLHKGKSLESLTMQLDYKPWYDRERIRGSVSRESIANLGMAKEKFEREDYIDRSEPMHRQFGTEFNNRPMTPHSQQPSRPATSMGKPMNQGILKTAENSPPLAPMHQNPPPYNIHQGYNNYPPPPPQPQFHQPQQQHHSQEHYLQPMLQQQQHQQQPIIHHHPIQHHQQQLPLRQQQAVNLSADHYMLLQYIKQNPGVFNDFGIEIPKKLYNLVDDLAFPESNNHNGVSRHQTPVQPVQPTPQNRGRYLKNGTQNNVNPRFRRTYDMSQKQMPENRRQSMQELDHSKAGGDSLIAAEIRAIQEREDELRRSRSELGLPNLEDTFEQWKLGYHYRYPSKQLREAASYDHLNTFTASTDELNQYDEGPSAIVIHQQHGHQPHHHSQTRYHGSTNSADMQQQHVEQHNKFNSNAIQSQSHHPKSQSQQHPHNHQQQQQQFRQTPTSSYFKERQSGTQSPFIIGSTNSTKDRYQQQSRNDSGTPTTNVVGYKLHKSEDPDVMIYGPPMRRNADSTVKLIESPAFGHPPNGLRNIRYE